MLGRSFAEVKFEEVLIMRKGTFLGTRRIRKISVSAHQEQLLVLQMKLRVSKELLGISGNQGELMARRDFQT